MTMYDKICHITLKEIRKFTLGARQRKLPKRAGESRSGGQ